MKKRLFLLVVLLVVALILFANLIFHLIYFVEFHKHIIPLSELDRERVASILNKSIGVGDYKINGFNVYSSRGRVNVEVINGSLKKHYLLDLNEERVVKKI